MADGEILDPPPTPYWSTQDETMDGPTTMDEEDEEPEVYADPETLHHQDEVELEAMELDSEQDGVVAELGSDVEIGSDEEIGWYLDPELEVEKDE
ncbi:hypothetical protein NL676_034350 [Syzygium grande]|nr:hypothetical protein NL676_034350 [Syzygium grande]